MIVPDVSSRIKQCCNGARVRIDAAEVWPLVSVATVAGERKTTGIVTGAMLTRNDMFNMERNKRRRLLRNAAILARVAGTPSHKLP
jgi:hypothetical protein